MEEEKLQEIEAKVNIKTKTFTVLSKEENMAKLQVLIEKGKQRLADLAEEWEKVQKPLLVEYNSLKKSLADQEVYFCIHIALSTGIFLNFRIE